MSKLVHPLPFSLLLLSFFFIVSMAAESNPDYPDCPSSSCNDVEISYPFWTMEDKTISQFCGYEGFGINCSTIGDRYFPIMTFANDSYYVDQIFYGNRSIILVDIDVSAPVAGLCPRVRHSIDLRTLPLNFTSLNLNLSFHFNCIRIPDFATPIPCLKLDNKTSCVNVLNTETEDFDWGEYECEEEVVTTVLDRHPKPLGWLTRGMNETLSKGFELIWRRLEHCVACEESYGRCGHNSDENEFRCFCPKGKITIDHCRVVVVVLLMNFVIYIGCCMCNTRGFVNITRWSASNCVALFKHRTEDDKSVESFIMQYGSLTTKRYKYVDVKKMTNSFKDKLGQGGFGSVFKGKLPDGRLVAVKLLNSSKASGQEFINEVASIGRTSHVNIVALVGFCFDYEKRALVYEFMPNGSLDKFICCDAPLKNIGVNTFYDVALGIARGLDYLHRGCTTRILHLDIKPHNILLDEDFCPKIADFGLAKLYSRKESIVSMLEARGTIGYIAPEIFNRNFGGVSHKSDVYSYGMMMLEMVGGRKNGDVGVRLGQSSEIYFPDWIYNRLEKNDLRLEVLTTAEDNDCARKMTMVGLWCIQTNPTHRPSINEVIEMLEGSTKALKVPPKPFFSSPPRSPASTLSTSQSDPMIAGIQNSMNVEL